MKQFIQFLLYDCKTLILDDLKNLRELLKDAQKESPFISSDRCLMIFKWSNKLQQNWHLKFSSFLGGFLYHP